MKYITLVPDGVADEPLKELGGRTPLEAAHTPNMDAMVQKGLSALVRIIPEGMAPGSDVGNVSVLGYDARKGFSGRAPLEAANLGIVLSEGELAFRCNLVTIRNDVMVDYSAGHISINEAAEIVKTLDQELSDDIVKFYTGKSYRHIAIVKAARVKDFLETRCTPPHDITGQKIAGYRPNGPMAEFLQAYVQRAEAILQHHPVNTVRLDLKEEPANSIWFWGQGVKPGLERFQDRYGMKGSIISAVDLVNGIGRIVGLDVVSVPGATGYYDTNYKGKADYGLKSLKNGDFIYIHVEATDEAGHNGDIQAKIKAIEDFDRDVVGPALQYCQNNPDTRVLVTPDHPTPISKRTHTADPVPFIMFGKGIEHNGLDSYNELSASTKGIRFKDGVEMVRHFMGKG
ncbi:MAG: cofactor-independent phosphoglycerate mutase [Candidatus Omnitrophica bacterium]|nr:cofactor-independent phosphoglycerate mutase [Candidatus Omnitrophota bacterium]